MIKQTFYGRWIKLPINSTYQPEQYPDLYKVVSCREYGLAEMFALKYKRFTTFLTSNVSTMVSAWSRRYLNQEKAYATL